MPRGSVSNPSATSLEFSRLRTKDASSWNVSEVATWLDLIDCKDYKITFIENSISGAELFELTESDLISIGVKKLQKRKQILQKIAQLMDGANSAFDPASGDDISSIGSNSVGSDSSNMGMSSGSKRNIKCVFEGETRLLKVAHDVTFSKLKKAIKKEFGESLAIKWKDGDGDLIVIRRESHWKDCLHSSPPSGAIRLELSQKEAFSKNEFTFLESLVDGVIIINVRGQILFFNASAERMFGYKREEVIEKNVKLLMPVEYAEQHDNFLRNYQIRGVGNVIGSGRNIVAQRKDGSTFSAYLAVNECKKPGNKIYFTGTIKPLGFSSGGSSSGAVTSQSEAARYQILDNLLDSCAVIDQKGTILFVNKELTKILGYKSTELIGRNVKMLMPNPFRDEHDSFLRNYLTTRKAKVIGIGRDVVAQCKDDTIIPVHLSLTEHKLGDTAGTGEEKSVFTGILRRTASEAPSEKSVLEREREVLDNLVIPAIIIDQRGIINAFNMASRELFGYSLVEVVGKNIKMLMPSPEKENHDEYLSNYLKTGKSKVLGVGRDVLGIHKNGSMIPIRLSVTCKKMENDQFLFTGILQKLS